MSGSRWAVTAAAATAVLVSGCGAEDPSLTGEADVLHACVVTTPLSAVQAPDGSWSGLDVELLGAVADRFGSELELTEVAFDDVVAGTATSDAGCDVVAGALASDDGIDEALARSLPYRDQVLLVAGAGTAGELPEFGPRLALGHVQDDDVAALAEDVTSDVSAYPSLLDAVASLDTGRARALLVTPEEFDELRGAVPGIRVLGTVPTGEQVSLVLPASSSAELRAEVDAAVQAWIDDGSADAALERWSLG